MTAENKIFSAEQFKKIDSTAIKLGISSKELMHNAAKALFARLDALNKLNRSVTVVCGAGNNGGDGYALAALLKEANKTVSLIFASSPKTDDALYFREKYCALGGELINGCAEEALNVINGSSTVVDCLFGFSFHGEAEGVYRILIDAINNSEAFVLSADLPSGLTADSDELKGICVKADVTSTFTANKIATVSHPAYAHCGKVFVENIGISQAILNSEKPLGLISDKSTLSLIPPRRPNSHKGTYGTVAAIVGTKTMSGAAYLSALASLKSGVGLVKLLTDEGAAATLKSMLPEAIVFSTKEESGSLFWKSNDAFLLGCGCGRKYDDLFEKLLPSISIPTVIDADGINFLANRIELLQSIKAETLITPHPGEMARLVGKTTEQVNSSRVATAKAFSKSYGTVTLLKGERTVIASPDGRLFVNTSGCSALSKGGSGDVLAGLTASLLAQGVPAFEAACLGAYLHGLAAEVNEIRHGAYATLPSELPQTIGELMQSRGSID